MDERLSHERGGDSHIKTPRDFDFHMHGDFSKMRPGLTRSNPAAAAAANALLKDVCGRLARESAHVLEMKNRNNISGSTQGQTFSKTLYALGSTRKTAHEDFELELPKVLPE
jgi:hypothetical protein